MRYALLLAASALLLSGAGCDKLRTGVEGRAQKSLLAHRKLSLEEAQQLAARLCSSPGTYERLKVAAFRQAAHVRGTDSAPFDRLAAFATVRMEEPLVTSGDHAPSMVRCSARMAIDLPPGTAAINGARSLASDIAFYGQPAADGSGLVWTLSAAEPIIYPLATLRRITGEEFLPPPVLPAETASSNDSQPVEPATEAKQVAAATPPSAAPGPQQGASPPPAPPPVKAPTPERPTPVRAAPAQTPKKIVQALTRAEASSAAQKQSTETRHEPAKPADQHKRAKPVQPVHEPPKDKGRRTAIPKRTAPAKQDRAKPASKPKKVATPVAHKVEPIARPANKHPLQPVKRVVSASKPKPLPSPAPRVPQPSPPRPRAAPAPVARHAPPEGRFRQFDQPSAPRRVAPSRRGRSRYEDGPYGYDPYRYPPPPPPPPPDDDGGY